MLLALFTDVRFALRLMWRSPGFYAMLLVILALGTGATTAMFSIAECLLLRPLPYPNAEELTLLGAKKPVSETDNSSIPDYLDWKAQSKTFVQMAAMSDGGHSLTSPGALPESVHCAHVSGEFFEMLGAQPLRGRLFGPEDDRIGGPNVAVISASLWRKRFGADPNLIGRTITLDGQPHTVVGVAPDGFRFAGPNVETADLWLPFALAEPDFANALSHPEEERGSHFLHVIGRRKAGVTLAQAQEELTAIGMKLEAEHPSTNASKGVLLVDLHDRLVGRARSDVWVLFAAVGLVFVVVCANVSNLLLTRAQSRRAEMALRSAVGGTFARLSMQIVTETVLLFGLGALGGAFVARFMVDWFAEGVHRSGGAYSIDLRVDGLALAFSIGTSLLSGTLAGLVPAMLSARVPPHAVLKDTSAGAGVGHSQRAVRGGLVVAQVAVAFALLVGSGLALRAFAALASTPPGFEPSDVATARVTLPESKSRAEVRNFFRALIERVAAQPGVEAVGADNTLPMGGWDSSGPFLIEGRPPWPRGRSPHVWRNSVTPGYFKALRIPLLRGRDFADADHEASGRVVILNRRAAERFFPSEDPIGKRIDLNGTRTDEPVWREIVGVVGDVRREGLAYAPEPEVFVPFAQIPNGSMVLVIRTKATAALLGEFPALVQSIDPTQAVSSRERMVDRVEESIESQRHITFLLAAFALAALLLATLGLFGLVSYTTSQRTRELGLRMALGSSPSGVVALVFRGGMRLILIGLALGLILAIAAGRILASRMDGVNAFDPALYAIIPAVLAIAGLFACLLPALRAVRIPPANALRYE